MANGEYVPGSYYFYAPNKGAPIFFTIAFFCTGAFHLYQNIKYHSLIRTIFFPFCSLLFTAGFALRIYGSHHFDDLNVYIASICIIYAAPPLLELQNYNILGRILYYVPYHSPIHPGRVLSTFAFISGIIEALNGWGASLTANQSLKQSTMDVGHILIKTALLMQLAVAACFLVLAGTFHRRCRANGIRDPRVQQPLCTLYASMALIVVRTIYRVVEYFGVASLRYADPDFDPTTMTPLIRYEWWFYVFEASLMLINLVMMNVRHPRKWLPRSSDTYLAVDGVTEKDGPGWKDPAPFCKLSSIPLISSAWPRAAARGCPSFGWRMGSVVRKRRRAFESLIVRLEEFLVGTEERWEGRGGY
ncbi:unnamed protein product [Parascedosporium putredinis]|uniref:RTA1 domain protein n=1 Tax=Parascedosporium putredinis TaxID=1442378 RepID=A0A9P1GWM1_9PEZI|nr:unnamed protein product [Parascedosporium putredinis]CAI7988964.1 unnamed protein product [Parascedosporium putredinis]